MPSLVAVDLETTGLDASKDAIIEIGAVRFNGSRVEAEFTTLINPGRAIPAFITQLTGISNEMVRNAPPLRAVLHDLVDFIGDLPVLGHNVRFDLGFLQRAGVVPYNDVVDTYELASVLMPRASRYNLGALGQQLGVMIKGSTSGRYLLNHPHFHGRDGSHPHSGLHDARLTHAVFHRLSQMAEELPTELIADIVRMSEPMDWDGAWLFRQILRSRAFQKIQPRRIGERRFSVRYADGGELLGPALGPCANPSPLDVDGACAYLQDGGLFSNYISGFEHRRQQVDMLRAVCEAFNDNKHLLVEAGTGTGKSYAYLLPAALWAAQNRTRVVISTNTINLQEQLLKKDIPDLCAAMQLDVRATVLKGRANYLCPRRMEALLHRGPETPDEMRVLAKILVWLHQDGQGDRSEINLNGPVERDLWLRLSAEDEGCRADICAVRAEGGCPFYRARTAAQHSHLVVVNHALLLADVITGGSRVLPEHDYLIIDEGHHLEAASTGALSYAISQGDLNRMLRELGSTSSGVLGRLLTTLQGTLRPSDMAAAHQQVDRATDIAFRLEQNLRLFFNALDIFLESQRSGQSVGVYGQSHRILPSTRTLPAWNDVEIAYDSASDSFHELTQLTSQLHYSLGSMLDEADEDMQDVVGNFGNVVHRLCEAESYLRAMIQKPDPGYVYWVDVTPVQNRLSLQAAPLHIGPLMEQYLWHEKSSVILTSATLTTQGEFDYLRSRLNADEADEIALGSPFDFERAALLYLVNDIPEPNDLHGHQRAVEQVLVRLSKATQGRLLALFTSYAQLRKTSTAIYPYLIEAGIQVYEQGEGASPSTLLETFRENSRAVLLGTKAFWEGVDIPGDALSVLVIVKLPFDVPTEPLIAARSETFDDPFNEYSLPEAILRFRQGFGRLIRTARDRGVVVVLDKRVLSKRYGRSFIESLPTCHTHTGSMHDLPTMASRWLDR